MQSTRIHLSEREFTVHCLGLMAKEGIAAREKSLLSVTITLGSYKSEHALRNLYQNYLIEDPGSLDAIVRSFISELRESLESASVARKALSIEEGLDLVFPMIKPDEMVTGSVSMPFLSGLSVVYAVDLPTAWRFVDQPLLEQWALGKEALHDKAVENLLQRSRENPPEIVPGDTPFAVYQLGDGFDSARALILDKLHQDADGFIFAIPARDQLLYLTTVTAPEPFLDAMRMQTEQDFDTMDNHLSRELWLWAGGDQVPVALK